MRRSWRGAGKRRGGAGEEGVGCGGGGFFVGLEYGDGLDNTGPPSAICCGLLFNLSEFAKKLICTRERNCFI